MKRLLLLLLAISLGCLFPVPVFAKNHISTIDIDAVIYEDGSMYITQVWDGDFDEGTECYLPINAPDYLRIRDLRVADGNGPYQFLERWDLKASFGEKANKYGIHDTNDGYEICFGISEYGRNRYAIEYRLENVIGGYTDMDGVNFRFVNSGLNTTPTDVNLEIRLGQGIPITDENSDIWAFGFQGQAIFEDGVIRAYTEKPVTSRDHVTLMVGFKKGLLEPQRLVNESFETLKSKAFENSDYDYGEEEEFSLAAMMITVLALTFPLALIILILKLKKRKSRRKMQKFAEQAGYFRDLPNKGNANGTYALGRLFDLCEDGALLGTGILRLTQLECLLPASVETVDFMGRTKEVVSLRLAGANHGKMNEYDEYLYTVLEGAAGPDGILQPRELPSFVEKNDTPLRNYLDKCDQEGRKYLKQRDCLKRWDMPSKLEYLTENGKKELGELVGFKRYLEEFTLVAERGVKEIPIWRELLSYALLFGVADKVAGQLEEMYPDLEAEMKLYSQTITSAYTYSHLMSDGMRQAEERRQQAARSSGSGGSSSRGGGGGSIGGGSGGGTR